MTPGVHRQVPFGPILDHRRKVHFQDANTDQLWVIGQKVHFPDANTDQFRFIREGSRKATKQRIKIASNETANESQVAWNE